MTGVSCSPESISGPQMLENLMKKLELLGAVKCGRIHVESVIYFSNNPKYTQTALVADLAFREFPGYLKAVYQRKKKLQIEGKGVKYQLGDFDVNFITLFMGQSATVKGYLIEVTFRASHIFRLCCDILRAFITQLLADVCPPSNDPNSPGHTFSESFHRAVRTGNFESPRWPSNQLNLSAEYQFPQTDSVLPHTCARLTMTQYAEHINVIRRLAIQPVYGLTGSGTSGSYSAHSGTPSSGPTGVANASANFTSST